MSRALLWWGARNLAPGLSAGGRCDYYCGGTWFTRGGHGRGYPTLRHQTSAFAGTRLLMAASLPLAFAQTAFILGRWARGGMVERMLMLPSVPASRIAYAAGMTVGGIAWLWREHTSFGWYQPR